MTQRDSAGAWRRRTRAQRRAGVGAACALCDERRPFALIYGRVPPCCYACDRVAHERPPYEDDHPFLRSNGELTIRVPVNDHRALLSVRQYEWPPETRENPDSDPFLASAARYRGLYNVIEYMLADCLKEAERLEQLSARMRRKYGPQWWCEAPRSKRGQKADRKP